MSARRFGLRRVTPDDDPLDYRQVGIGRTIIRHLPCGGAERMVVTEATYHDLALVDDDQLLEVAWRQLLARGHVPERGV